VKIELKKVGIIETEMLHPIQTSIHERECSSQYKPIALPELIPEFNILLL